MDRPGKIYLPPLHAGVSADIRWDPVAGATGYSLQRQVDGGEYRALYGGEACEWSDRIPSTAELVRYRVQAYVSADLSWDGRDALQYNWAQWDQAGGLWGEAVSGWTESESTAVIANTLPVISGEDEDLGAFSQRFAVDFHVEDPDPEASVEVVALLDGGEYRRFEELELGVSHQLWVEDEMLEGMASGSVHSLELVATDNNQGEARRRYSFTVVEDYERDSVFYVLRDGSPVARLEGERRWSDYLAVGTHSYVVRGVDRDDNFVDSNELVVTLELEQPVIAAVERPEELLALSVRRGDSPVVLRATELPQGSELYFEGRALPVMVGCEHPRRSYTLRFSSLSMEEYEMLGAMTGKTVAYRDHYGQRIFGVLTRLEQEHWRRGGGYDAVVDFTAELREVDCREEVDYD